MSALNQKQTFVLLWCFSLAQKGHAEEKSIKLIILPTLSGCCKVGASLLLYLKSIRNRTNEKDCSL